MKFNPMLAVTAKVRNLRITRWDTPRLGAREVNPRQKSFRPGLGALRQMGSYEEEIIKAFGFLRAEKK